MNRFESHRSNLKAACVSSATIRKSLALVGNCIETISLNYTRVIWRNSTGGEVKGIVSQKRRSAMNERVDGRESNRKWVLHSCVESARVRVPVFIERPLFIDPLIDGCKCFARVQLDPSNWTELWYWNNYRSNPEKRYKTLWFGWSLIIICLF